MKLFRNTKQHLPTLDDIVFEHRNKGYGCYQLRSTFKRRLKFSFLLVLAIFFLTLLVIYFWVINPLDSRFEKFDSAITESVLYNPGIIPVIIQMPSKPRSEKIRLDNSTEQEYTAEQVNTSNIKKPITVKEHKPILPQIDTSYKKVISDLLQRHKNNILAEKSLLSDTLSIILDKAPEFPGGYLAIQYYFYKNQHYPRTALLAGIHGSTIVSFVINVKGFVEDARVVSGIDPELDVEAIRLVKAMPAWQPAIYKGSPIACMLIMPVNFSVR